MLRLIVAAICIVALAECNPYGRYGGYSGLGGSSGLGGYSGPSGYNGFGGYNGLGSYNGLGGYSGNGDSKSSYTALYGKPPLGPPPFPAYTGGAPWGEYEPNTYATGRPPAGYNYRPTDYTPKKIKGFSGFESPNPFYQVDPDDIWWKQAERARKDRYNSPYGGYNNGPSYGGYNNGPRYGGYTNGPDYDRYNGAIRYEPTPAYNSATNYGSSSSAGSSQQSGQASYRPSYSATQATTTAAPTTPAPTAS